MQIPDVNVLVCALREDSPHHDECRSWLDNALGRAEPLGLSELVLSGVLRVLTHPRIFDPPTPPALASDYVDALLAQPPAVRLRPGENHWRIFDRLRQQIAATGNRVPDAYHAALAIEHGCEWVTLDRGFAAYPGLATRNLIIES